MEDMTDTELAQAVREAFRYRWEATADALSPCSGGVSRRSAEPRCVRQRFSLTTAELTGIILQATPAT